MRQMTSAIYSCWICLLHLLQKLQALHADA